MALFIPLKSKYYDEFIAGTKTEEFRLYGPRWNEKTCFEGRPVVLSKGYGKKNRASGTVIKFRSQHATKIGKVHHQAIIDCYGSLDVFIARISIANITKGESQ